MNLDYDIEEKAREKQLNRLLVNDKVKQAMELRCEIQGHEWDNACSIGLQIYEICQWCGKTR